MWPHPAAPLTLPCRVSVPFFHLTFFTVPVLFLTAGFFLTHYTAAYTATCEWDGGTNPSERMKGEGEEEQEKGRLSKHWWLINVVLLFQPHLKQHLLEASCYLREGRSTP